MFFKELDRPRLKTNYFIPTQIFTQSQYPDVRTSLKTTCDGSFLHKGYDYFFQYSAPRACEGL